jgi:type IV pilus assembly protein PilX
MTRSLTLPAPHRQSGVTLLMTLICLTLLLVATVALSRSSVNTLLQAGNFSFKRDLLNQAERGMAQAVRELSSGTLLASESNRQADQPSYNYSATQLASNDQGIPLLLISDSSYKTAGMSASDLSDSAAGVTIRTVIDRQCNSAGAYSASSCTLHTEESSSALTGTARLKYINANGRPSYRITVRVTGPRNTQVFEQLIVVL